MTEMQMRDAVVDLEEFDYVLLVQSLFTGTPYLPLCAYVRLRLVPGEVSLVIIEERFLWSS